VDEGRIVMASDTLSAGTRYVQAASGAGTPAPKADHDSESCSVRRSQSERYVVRTGITGG